MSLINDQNQRKNKNNVCLNQFRSVPGFVPSPLTNVKATISILLVSCPYFQQNRGGQEVIINYYANEPMQSVVYIRFNYFLNPFHYYCNA